MSDLFDDLQDGSAQDYFFGLDSAPGGLTVGSITLSVRGLEPTIFQQTSVFRSPATAVLTLNGMSLVSDLILRPAAAILSLSGQIADELRSVTITPAVPDLDYSEPVSNPPTILFINTITPSPGLVNLGSLELNVTPGGNIAFVQPSVGLVRIAGNTPTLIFHTVELGSLAIAGYAPTLQTELILGTKEDPSSDDPPGVLIGSISVQGLTPTLVRPFTWVDVDPPSPTTWTTTTGVAA